MVYTSEYPPFYVTADAVVLSGEPEQAQVLVIRRRNPPFQGHWALPGGFVDPDEDPLHAAVRELEEETGLRITRMRQLGAYGAVDRDPRHRTVSIAHLAVVPEPLSPKAGDDAEAAAWRPVAELLAEDRLAFDHAHILRDALQRLSAQ